VSQLSKALQSEELPHPIQGNQQNPRIGHSAPSPNKTELREVASQYRLIKERASFYNQLGSLNDCSETPWAILNKHYSVLWIQQQPYLVDIDCLYRHWLHTKMAHEEFSFVSRPLLVTVCYSLVDKTVSEPLQRLLLSVGITIEVGDEELIIRTIPIAIPYLDLKLFFDGLFEIKNCSLSHLHQHLVNSQLIDAYQLSGEERMELSQYIMDIQPNEPIYSLVLKPLTSDNCRMLFDV
jgi:DNA mismatch repair protein MutL